MNKKILKLCHDTNVVWIFDESAKEEYGEAILVYNITHVVRLTKDVYELRRKENTVALQFGVKEVREKW